MSDDQFDRVPPQDIDAEMSVLGSMMLTTEAANVVSEMLRGQDFYQPSHETIFDTIVELNGRAEPADAITVAGELKRAGVLSKVGGAAYLHSLIASVPTAANAAYYARIVRERAIMRRLVTAGTRVVLSDNMACTEVMNDEAGFFFSRSRPETLAQAVAQAAALKQQGRHKIADPMQALTYNPTLEHHIDQTVAMLEAV